MLTALDKVGQPAALPPAVMGAAGPGHRAGLVPDPGADVTRTYRSKFLSREAVFAAPIPDVLEAWGNGFAHNGTTDDTAAWDALIAYNESLAVCRRIQLPVNNNEGGMRLARKPRTLPRVSEVWGYGPQQTIIRRAYTPADPDEIFLEFAHTGSCGLHDVYVNANAGTSGGRGLGLVGTPTVFADFSRFTGLVINGLYGGVGTWKTGLYLNGLLKTGAGGEAPGMRDFRFYDIMIAQCTDMVIESWGAKAGHIYGLWTVPPVTGPVVETTARFDGGSPTTTMDQFRVSGSQLPSILIVDHASNFHMDGASVPKTITFGADANYCLVVGGGNGGNPVAVTDSGTGNLVVQAGEIVSGKAVKLRAPQFQVLGAVANAVTRIAPATGFNIAVASNVSSLILTPAATLASGTVTAPLAPAPGHRLSVVSTAEITAFSFAPGAGQTVVGAPTALAANAGFTMQYDDANLSWYRIA